MTGNPSVVRKDDASVPTEGQSNDSHLIPLRTKGEVDARPTFGQALVLKLPSSNINNVLRIVDEAIEAPSRGHLSHLRRVIKHEHLPAHIQHERSGADEGDVPSLYLLLCATNVLSLEKVQTLLSTLSIGPIDPFPVTVPLTAPLSKDQATQWTQTYWPSIYRSTNPFGPQHHVIASATTEVQTDVSNLMQRANSVALATAEAELGRSIGAVVVERDDSGTKVLAAAGDARWHGPRCKDDDGPGNVMAHAVMRVIGMIARRRCTISNDAEADDVPGAYADTPLTPAEVSAYSENDLASNGYLCVDLEIYLTHEPCVMCSMALLHSRFGRVIFERGMPTGGLRADGGLGYGLHWLPKLNWRFLAWQYKSDELDEGEAESDESTIHA